MDPSRLPPDCRRHALPCSRRSGIAASGKQQKAEQAATLPPHPLCHSPHPGLSFKRFRTPCPSPRLFRPILPPSYHLAVTIWRARVTQQPLELEDLWAPLAQARAWDAFIRKVADGSPIQVSFRPAYPAMSIVHAAAVWCPHRLMPASGPGTTTSSVSQPLAGDRYTLAEAGRSFSGH